MAGRQGLKSGILFIILGLGISMCSPVLYLLSRAVIDQNKAAIALDVPEKQGSLHAEDFPQFQNAEAKHEVRYSGRAAPYIQRYLASKRLFPRSFVVQPDDVAHANVADKFWEQFHASPEEAKKLLVAGLHFGPFMDDVGRSGKQEAKSELDSVPNSGDTGTTTADSAVTGSDLQQNPAIIPAVTENLPVLSHSQVLAYYGKPGSRAMGILGQYTKEQLAPMLESLASEYDKINGALGIVPAFYIIYGTCWPEGNIGYVSKAVVKEYIEFAQERGWLVFLDHQIGKFDVVKSLETMYEFLQYPNVHLALDPEWRTTKPMQEIGYVSADEINKAQESFQNYLTANKLPGPRMLVIHQFKPKMIQERDAVKATYDQIVLVHVADGFGNPALKKNTYNMVAGAQNIPVKGFKLFYPPAIAGAGWDNPLMSPQDVLSLQPMPLVIMYQ